MKPLRPLVVLLLCAGCTLKDSLIDGDNEATLRSELAAQRARADSLQKQMTRFSRTADERDSALAIARATQDQLDEVDAAMSALPGATQRQLEIGKPAELADDPATAEKIAEKISRARDLMRQSDEALERLRVSAAAARDSLHEEARRYDESIALMTAILERQRVQIETATAHIAELELSIAEKEKVIAVMSDTVAAIRARERRVFVAAGTEDELLQSGVLVKEGGRKILGWTTGQSVVPNRTATRRGYRELDMLRDLSIELPDKDVPYRILSRHDVRFLKNAEGGVLRSRVEVSDPAQFWEASRYLILVREN